MSGVWQDADTRPIQKNGICPKRIRRHLQGVRAKTPQKIGGGTATVIYNNRPANPELAQFSARQLIEELCARGYKWNKLWLERVTIERKEVVIK